MKSWTDVFNFLLVFFGAVILHWFWSTHLSFLGLSPQILLVLTVSAASRRGPIMAMSLGFFWGLVLDVMAPNLFGANALALVLAAYATGSVRRQLDAASLPSQILLVMFNTWGYFLVLGIISLIFTRNFFWVGWTPFLGDPFYNGIVAAVVYSLWTPKRMR